MAVILGVVSETAVQRLRLQIQDIIDQLLLRVPPKIQIPETSELRSAARKAGQMLTAAEETEKALAALPKSDLRKLTVITVRCPKGALLLQVVRIPDRLPGARYARHLVMPTSAATYVMEYPDEQSGTGAWFLNHHNQTFNLRCRCHPRPVTLTPQQLCGESRPPRTTVVSI